MCRRPMSCSPRSTSRNFRTGRRRPLVATPQSTIRRPALAAATFATIAILLLPRPATAEHIVLEELPRRAFLGVSFNAGENGNPQIASVARDAAAYKAGLREDDLILQVDEHVMGQPGALTTALTGKRGGDVLKVRLQRGEEEVELDVTLEGAPLEPAEGFDSIYDGVELDGGDTKLRSITLRPEGQTQAAPAVLFVQGLACSSVEQPIGAEPNTVLRLIQGLANAGFVVMRVEKMGIGDSSGEEHCRDIGFHREVEGFAAAARKLKTYDFVDASQIYVFGHSMGGIQGPMVVNQEDLAGIMVFGTGIKAWGEYLVDNTRRQSRLNPEADRVEIEATARQMARFYHYLFREGLEVKEIAAAHPDLAAIGSAAFPDGTHGYTRHVNFFRELDAVNMAGVWAEVEVPVLALFGEYDFATSREAHEYIVEIVNQKHPDQARFVQIPQMFHAFNLRDSMEQALQDPWNGEFGEQIVDECVAFLLDAGAQPPMVRATEGRR